MIRHARTLIATIALISLLAGCASTKPGNEFVTSDMSGIKDVQLITRDMIFEQPEIARLRLSPDGERIAFLKPLDDVMNIWVGPADDFTQAIPLTRYTDRDLGSFSWALNGEMILYSKDKDGNEERRLYGVNVDGESEPRLLTPAADDLGIRVGIASASEDHPWDIIVSMNDKPPYQQSHLYKLNLKTGEMGEHFTNPGFVQPYGMFLQAVLDDDYNVKMGITINPMTATFSVLLWKNGEWTLMKELPSSEIYNANFHGFSKDGKYLYTSHSVGRDKSALFKVNLDTLEEQPIFAPSKADIGGVILDSKTGKLLALTVTYLKTGWKFFDAEFEAEIKKLRTLKRGELNFVGATLDDRKWMVAFISDKGTVDYYLWDRDSMSGKHLLTLRPEFNSLPFQTMHPVEITARDGLVLPCYLTLPAHAKRKSKGSWALEKPVPLVLDVHGGPHARDTWGFNGSHQIGANRGYAVLSVNYRGSTGFGKEFVQKSMKQWGRAMHDDLLDAVQWCIDQGIADKDRVAITGGSYGGYATLWGMTNTPEWFCCGVDTVGPSNLLTLLENMPPSWRPTAPMMYERMGNPNTEEGRALLKERSPLFYVENINKPLLIGQGANDPRVTQVESDQIVEAMRKNNIPVTYVLYPDEGHGWSRRENNFSWTAVQEAFLAKHLGGRYEPISDDFKDSSIQVLEGADGVPGLVKALSTLKSDPESSEGDAEESAPESASESTEESPAEESSEAPSKSEAEADPAR